MPAKAGIQKYLKTLDSRLRGNDAKGAFSDFLRIRQILVFKYAVSKVSFGPISVLDSCFNPSKYNSTYDDRYG